MQNWMTGNESMMMGWGGMFFGPLMMIGFFALFVFVVVMIIKAVSNKGPDQSASDDPSLSLLKKRYAAGEIDAAEYQDRKHQLEA